MRILKKGSTGTSEEDGSCILSHQCDSQQTVHLAQCNNNNNTRKHEQTHIHMHNTIKINIVLFYLILFLFEIYKHRNTYTAMILNIDCTQHHIK